MIWWILGLCALGLVCIILVIALCSVVDDLERSKVKAKKKESELVDKIGRIEAARNALSAKFTPLEKEATTLKKELANLRDRDQTQSALVVELQKVVSSREAELQQFATRFNEQSVLSRESEQALDAAKQISDAQTKDLAVLEGYLTELQDRIYALSGNARPELPRNEIAVDVLKQIGLVAEQLGTFQREIEARQARIDWLKGELDGSRDTHDNYVRDRQQEISRLQTELEDTKRDRELFFQDVQAANEKVRQLQTRYNDLFAKTQNALKFLAPLQELQQLVESNSTELSPEPSAVPPDAILQLEELLEIEAQSKAEAPVFATSAGV